MSCISCGICESQEETDQKKVDLPYTARYPFRIAGLALFGGKILLNFPRK